MRGRDPGLLALVIITVANAVVAVLLAALQTAAMLCRLGVI